MKQSDVQSIEINNLDMDTVVAGFCRGCGIVFVTEHGILAGAVTEGDIKRCFRNGQYTINASMVNHNISYIVECGDSLYTYARAEEIFKSSSKIHNIPVVDGKGVLLYQIDRENDMFFEHVKSCLKVICKGILDNVLSSSFSIFLECHNVKHIVLAGGETGILNWSKEYLAGVLSQFGNAGNVDIIIADDVFGCQEPVEETLVICISEIVAYYLKKNYCHKVTVISIEEMKQYYYYKNLSSINENTVSDFIKLFGYETISICERNKYIDRIIGYMENLGVHIIGKSGISVVNFYETELCAYSMDGVLRESISIENFYLILEMLQKYHYIVGKPFTQQKYIKEFMAYIYRQKEMGADGIIFQEYNILDYKAIKYVKEKIKEFCVVKPGEKTTEGKYFIRDIQNNGHLKEICISSVLVNASYSVLCGFFNNVYVHRPSGKALYLNPNRRIENYGGNEGYFTPDFIEEMYGRKDFPIGQFLSDMKNCSVVRVNETHLKYQSNYVSEFFNTDTYGCRMVTGVPQEYIATIWLLGPCIYSGYAVTDNDTLASIFQERLNQSGHKYRVVNLSVSGANMWNYIDKIRETEIRAHDIVICWVQDMWNRKDDDHVIITDMDEFTELIGDNGYWDNVVHCGRKGYAIIAEQILDKIKPVLVSFPEKRFRLGDSLEMEIDTFIKDMVCNVKEMAGSHILCDGTVKAGAIVMNCNPFTYGHQYLIETASRLVDILYVFVVEEDKSVFPFRDRLQMVKEGVQDFSNVVVLPSGKFMISSVTFPGYFMKENPDGKCYDSFLDLKIFSHYIAPALKISKRFVGEEPFDKVTAQYNLDMKAVLGGQKIDVIEIPRKKLDGVAISATCVRKLMEKGEYSKLEDYVPDSTIKYLQNYKIT